MAPLSLMAGMEAADIRASPFKPSVVEKTGDRYHLASDDTVSTAPSTSASSSSSSSLSSSTAEAAESSTSLSSADSNESSPVLSRQRRHSGNHQVSFAKQAELYEIPSFHDHDGPSSNADGSTDQLWYTKEDYSRFEQENLDTLKYMMRRVYPGTSKRYFRGLEVHLPRANRERSLRTRRATRAVLTEQTKNGFLSPYWVHNVYCKYTQQSAQVAWAMGVWDAEANQAELLADSSAASSRRANSSTRSRRSESSSSSKR